MLFVELTKAPEGSAEYDYCVFGLYGGEGVEAVGDAFGDDLVLAALCASHHIVGGACVRRKVPA